ncbi:neurofilament medium polypeptide [Neocloeon triangulifer]|uniref:neurofilament medium polypeptide n=1 Tax=Neocloeon triangulifer TaxID=2078957 RepID=UPI00286EBA8B|nr:neurofilament medium polypeptide [Neocloeon triangulifer]
MVDNKLNTGSVKKVHLAHARKEKTEKIVSKIKSEEAVKDGGGVNPPPAKKPKLKKKQKKNAKNPDAESAEEKKEPKVENGEKKEVLRRPKKKKKTIAKEKVANIAKTEELQKELQQKATEYLNLWKNDRKNWKFVKNLQTWLVANVFDVEKVDNDLFQILAEYLKGATGNIRENVVKMSIKRARECTLKVDVEPEEDADTYQEIRSRSKQLIKLMTSKEKSKKQGEAPDREGKKKLSRRRNDKGRSNKFGLGKESKPKVTQNKEPESEDKETPALEKAKKKKVVSFVDEEVQKTTDAKSSPKKKKKPSENAAQPSVGESPRKKKKASIGEETKEIGGKKKGAAINGGVKKAPKRKAKK